MAEGKYADVLTEGKEPLRPGLEGPLDKKAERQKEIEALKARAIKKPDKEEVQKLVELAKEGSITQVPQGSKIVASEDGLVVKRFIKIIGEDAGNFILLTVDKEMGAVISIRNGGEEHPLMPLLALTIHNGQPHVMVSNGIDGHSGMISLPELLDKTQPGWRKAKPA